MIRVATASLLLSGCAAQLTSGAASTATARPVVTGTLEGTMHALRSNNGVAGARIATVIDHGVVIKQGIVHGGYDMRVMPGRFTLEPGIDLGAGAPVVHRFEGVGAYAGVSGTARLRIYGMDDSVPAFEVISPIIELVLAPRVGAWMPPEGSSVHTVYAEYGCEFGIRFALGSDLASAEQGHVTDEPGGTSKQP